MSTADATVAAGLEARLRQLGVERVYGSPLAGLTHVPVDSPDLAVLLADADGRLGHHDGSGRLGAALLDGPILHLSSEPGGVAPRRNLAFEAGIRPEMMTMRREMQPLGIGTKAATEQCLEAQRSVLSDHNSGKTRLSSVERRYEAPAVPPVPILFPMIRSTVSTCLCRHIASASSRSRSFSASW